MDFHEELTKLLGDPTDFDSCNGWGFGGGKGKRWSRGNAVVKAGRAYYRHLSPTSFATLTIDGVRVIDEYNLDATQDAILDYLRKHV